MYNIYFDQNNNAFKKQNYVIETLIVSGIKKKIITVCILNQKKFNTYIYLK